ncbi:LysE family translocator [Pandoraea pnomenusa]|uniref:LysE family translocator n=1 Tax=Pandoraea pnomenusa TaxID=93220 RepID=UPI0033416FB0
MATSVLTAFWLVSLSLVVVPGADWAYAISAGMRQRAIVPAIAGLLLGYVAITLVVAGGVGALVARVPMLLTVLTYAGAAYLLWLGANAILRPSAPQAGAQETQSTSARWVAQGLAVSGLNPKALLLFLALLPQFTSPSHALSIEGQIAELGLVHMLNCLVVYSVVALGARLVLRARPAFARTMSRISGSAMVIVALVLVAEQVRR